ncbi:uncharacterized protein LOC115714350 [Cannabis sativa]|uniref:DNA repair metallo-beta-lactamase domain-containing protein n=2 Tax=Cannabis sativa TaxID=3483 RepID=A0A7J6G307_CANSA|nr:uncharacterized protein LOC115714350 [Cannabis sativa]KAF4377152.1 hypothetical protein F8388_017556 [Cannabis sativa]KAF4403708.1 hypothetical protein G4B88_002561 [Cannabis sativa]
MHKEREKLSEEEEEEQGRMPIEMPKGLPFSVDTWTECSKRKRYHFLTHAHKDHSTGITAHFSFPIYSTSLTKALLLQLFPKLHHSMFVEIEVGQSIIVDDSHDSFTVTAFDANHCPGAVMFLFEGKFGNILHTGDCRLTPECLQNLPEKYLGKRGRKPSCQLDFVFLDCTFGRFLRPMPSKHLATQQVVSCIWKHPDATIVYLTCDLLGQEEILSAVSRTFGSKIYVDKAANPECFHSFSLTAPEIISQDPSTRFHLFDGFPKLSERAKAKLMEAQANLMPEPLIIRPSSQWYACEDDGSASLDEKRRKYRMNEAVRDQFGVWHVCYSMHSSRQELEWALQLLAPKWVISTTPSCMATELDYFKKYCFTTRLSLKEPLWKLLDINVEASSVEDVLAKTSACSLAALEDITQSSDDSQLQLVKISTSQKENFKLPSPAKRPPVTLFGRARLGLQESPLLQQKKSTKKDEHSQTDDKFPQESLNEVTKEESLVINPPEYVNEIQCKESLYEVTREEPLVINPSKDVNEIQCKEPVEIETEVQSGTRTPIGPLKKFSEQLKRLNRSMDVPVPRPLPSLEDILNLNKRFKGETKF